MAKRKSAPPTPPDPTLPTDVDELRRQLILSRKLCAHYHRQLDLARQQVPLAEAPDAGESLETLRAANADLRWRLARLEAHLEQREQKIRLAEFERDELAKRWRGMLGFGLRQDQAPSPLWPTTIHDDLGQLLQALHPDKWGDHPVATEAAKRINALRERYAR